jgi:hypothetical protein
MSVRPDDWPAGLARTWATRYSRLLALSVALREYARKGWPSGCLQDLVTDAAREAVDAADHLRAHGYAPYLRVVGEEADLWERTVEYVASLPWSAPAGDVALAELVEWAEQSRSAWRGYAGFVAGLSDECFAHVEAMTPRAARADGLVALLGKRVQPPAPPQQVRQLPGELPDACVAVVAD